MYFVTTCHPGYDKPWIYATLGRLSCEKAALLDPDDNRLLPPGVGRFDFRNDRFYQDGRFLDALPELDPNEVVILSDADAVIQRDFNDAERTLLGNLGDAFAVGYNMKPGQEGHDELDILRIRPGLDIHQVAAALCLPAYTMANVQMYNWGLVAAKVSSWQFLRRVYNAHTRFVDPQALFVHPTWMQYLLCCLLSYYQIPVVELGYETHSHNHFGLQPEHSVQGAEGRVTLHYKGKSVFYAHHIEALAA